MSISYTVSGGGEYGSFLHSQAWSDAFEQLRPGARMG